MKGFFPSSAVQQDQPVGLLPKCGACGLFRHCQSPKMEPIGRGKSRILIVGEAPGATEDEEGKPFIGKAGQFLRQTLRSIGLDLERDAWVTNACICRPRDNTTPDSKQIEYCRPNLTKTIQTFNPNVIVPLGRSALQSVLSPYWRSDFRTLERWVGWKIPLQEHWVVPTYHPSYLLRVHNQLMDRQFADHLEAAFEIETLPPKQPDWKSKIEVLYNMDEIIAALKQIDETSEWAAVDYEANCLKPEYPKAQAYSFAVSNGKRTISYPWVGEAIKATGEFLRSKRTRKIASNLKMEERWTLKMFGHGVRNWGWDTMIAAHCLDNRPEICSLKFQSFIHLGVPTYNERIEPYLESTNGHYNRIYEIASGDLLLYGGMDAVLEHRLAMFQRKVMGYE